MEKTIKRATAALLTVLLCIGMGLPASAVEAPQESKNKYPIVFVHGMFGWGGNEGLNDLVPYWGATTGDLGKTLAQEGYDCCFASVGPLSSAWDRACELYAQLTGTRVDYGAAHAEAYGHARYGRSYDAPLFEGWGECGDDGDLKKIHLIGHSYGGTTVRVLAHLLTYGWAEELQSDDVSPLFTGGKEDWICSITTICAPHNGSSAFTAAEKLSILPVMEFVVYNFAGLMGRSRFNGNLVDYHMEQFGLTNTPGESDADTLPKAIATLWQTEDSVKHGLSPAGAAELNDLLEISPSIYYYSYAFDNAALADEGFIFLRLTSRLMQKHGGSTGNDGLVDITSAQAPSDEPAQAYDPEHISPGVWNVMPTRSGDHGTAIGLFADAAKTHRFYLELCAAANAGRAMP